MSRVAVIDTGTNSTRLLIADASLDEVIELRRLTTITRLGEGVDESGKLAAAARERVRACILGYADIIAGFNPDRVLVIATSSVRDAGDGEEFLAEVSKKHAFDYRVLSGNEEAQLSFSGAAIDFARLKRTMLFDVGGGSTEIVVGKGALVSYATSLRLGCVRLTERFFSSSPVPAGELAEAAAYIDNMLKNEIDIDAVAGIDDAVGVAGTVTSLAAIDLGLTSYDRERVHGHEMKGATVEMLLKQFASKPLEEMMRVPTMESGRADVIVAGALIVERLLRYTGVDSFSASENDILDGTAMAMAGGTI